MHGKKCSLNLVLTLIYPGELLFAISQFRSLPLLFHTFDQVANFSSLPPLSHIHWYERLFPLGPNATIDTSAIIDDHTYSPNPGKSLIHLINGQAGNVQSHDTLGGDPVLNITAVLDFKHYGFTKLTVSTLR